MRAPWAGPHSLKAKLFWVIIAVILVPQVVLGPLAVLPWVAPTDSGGGAFPDEITEGKHPPTPLPAGTAWPAAQLEEDPDTYILDEQAYLDYVRNRLPADVYEELGRRMEAFSAGAKYSGGGGGVGAIRQSGATEDVGAPFEPPFWLPEQALADLQRDGYAIGTTWIGDGSGDPRMQEADYVAFRIAGNEAWFASGIIDRRTGIDWAERQRWWPALWLCVWLGVNAFLAFVAATLLNRRIARPVARVAEASALLAAGGEPTHLTVSSKVPTEVAVLSASFNDMAAKLSRAQEAEQSFLLSVSHELKTPLTAIQGYGETLTEGRADPTTAGVVITKEASRLIRLVQDVLDLGRARKSSFAVHAESVDLAEVAREAGERYAEKALEYGLDLRVAAGDPAIVIADPDRVLQVVSNLVENALRCTPAEGVVTIYATSGEVGVIDTGPGLNRDDLARAFERFYLYERCSRDRQVGSGLGLSIVKELAEAMGGSVAVESRLGEGTTFAVRLPSGGDPET